MIEGAEDWVAERRNEVGEGTVGLVKGLMLGKLVAGVTEEVLVRVERYIVLGNVLKWW